MPEYLNPRADIDPGSLRERDRGQEPAAVLVVAEELPIGKEQVRRAAEILKKYKQGKTNLEEKIVRNEKWWKMRHWDLIGTNETADDPKPASGWLFNCIISKHADFMDSFPTINVLPRERSDEPEAKKLSSILPVVLDQNQYEQVYSDEAWYKLKNGTGIYGVFWDPGKQNGLGDISIKSMDILNLFWEPGVTDIQESRNFFCVELVDREEMIEQYPQLKTELSAGYDSTVKKYWYDDSIDTKDKVTVIDWYYKKTVATAPDARGQIATKQVLHYCKFVDETVLYATENDPILRNRGWYDHGKYPFVFDVLFKEEGMPVGFGFIDVCKHPQMTIDILNNAFEKNAMLVANPRYFVRNDGGLNEEEFLDPYNVLIHVDGNLSEDSLRAADPPVMINGNYIELLADKVNEMKETAGNRDTVNGGSTAGVTAASAIAAMQESAGKTSRDQIKTSYRAHEEVVLMVIDLIRQFYDAPRQFRIIGETGRDEYVSYSNAGLKPQPLGNDFGVDFGYRLPVFDIKVAAEKQSPYSQLSHNELALQFYNAGFFNPQMADQALAVIEMMEFDGKQKVVDRIEQNGTMAQQIAALQGQLLQLSEMVDRLSGGQTNLSEQMAAGIMADPGAPVPTGGASMPSPEGLDQESSITRNARNRAAEVTSPR